jgi:hypothetical protein
MIFSALLLNIPFCVPVQEYSLMVMDTSARRGPSGMGPPLKQVATGLILPDVSSLINK